MRCLVPLFCGWVGVGVKGQEVQRRKKKEACHDEADGGAKNGGEVEKRHRVGFFSHGPKLQPRGICKTTQTLLFAFTLRIKGQR